MSNKVRRSAALAALLVMFSGLLLNLAVPTANAAMSCGAVIQDAGQDFTYQQEDALTQAASRLADKGLYVRFMTAPPLDVNGETTLDQNGQPGPDLELQDGRALQRYVSHLAIKCDWGRLNGDQLLPNSHFVLVAVAPSNGMKAFYIGDGVAIQPDRIEHVLLMLEAGYATGQPVNGVTYAFDDLNQFLEVPNTQEKSFGLGGNTLPVLGLGVLVGVGLTLVVGYVSSRREKQEPQEPSSRS